MFNDGFCFHNFTQKHHERRTKISDKRWIFLAVLLETEIIQICTLSVKTLPRLEHHLLSTDYDIIQEKRLGGIRESLHHKNTQMKRHHEILFSDAQATYAM